MDQYEGKSSRLLFRESPYRALAIVSSSHALIFRYSPSASQPNGDGFLASVHSARPRAGSEGRAIKCVVEFTPLADELLRDYRPLTSRGICGTLGLISIEQDVFLCVITQASRVAALRPGETVERILSVDFYCLNTSEYDVKLFPDPWDNEILADSVTAYGQNPARREEVEYPYEELQKLLGNGSFYYSTDFDLTNRLQDRPVDSDTFDIDNFDDSFLWNSFMIGPLVQLRSRLLADEREALDASRILTSAIRGFCLTVTIPQASAPLRQGNLGLPSSLTVISRLSCKRAGTRFNSRGIDDDGNVANFVETETIYWSPSGILFSYAQVRGSVPVFWEQTAGLIPGQQKITITRSADGTQPAFNKHFEELERSYGAIHIVNLLSAVKAGEAELSQLYHYGVRHCALSRLGEKESRDRALLRLTDYDFHAETKAAGYESAKGIRRYLENSADGFAYYLAEETDDPAETGKAGNRGHRIVVVLQQEGVFRTNCLDCLDRTNLIQTILSQLAVESFLGHRAEHAAADFWMRHSTLWADNGDALSRIYAGTGALKTSFTRHGKMSLAGALADARKSATRLYINNFADKARQNNIDMLLGRLVGQAPVHLFDPISDFVTAELGKRSSEYSSNEAITMWVGSFNLNGRSTTGINEDLSPWLFPAVLGSVQAEIVVVGFQEIIELNPQQIMNSDPTGKQAWEAAVKRTLNSHAEKIGGEHYVLLRSGQLVGAALCIYVKASVLSKIKNVEGSVKKTGLSGIAGNKGAVAIRMEYANTQICFVTAHLAAGFANYEERNKDYATIHHGLRFQRNRSIDDHDTVVWLGDFNYRIGLSYERAMGLVEKRDLEGLYENDQLNLQMVAGLAFPYYSEARITFMPTYKFDIGTDRYDTSEKARIPAWTDRILRKGTNIRQLAYDSAPLHFSDHRPVFAVFRCTVNIVDEQRKQGISRRLYEQRKAEIGHSAANPDVDVSSEDEDLIGYEAIEPGLPPASSDRHKWWLESGRMARSHITAPKPAKGSGANAAVVLNPTRPPNPFAPTDEPDWVTVPRAGSRLSSFSSSISSSPYEHINHSNVVSTPASGPAPRKLLLLPPPPPDAGSRPAKPGWVTVSDDPATEQKNHGAEAPPPPPPPPRRAAAAPAVQGQQPPQQPLTPGRPPSGASRPTPPPRHSRPASATCPPSALTSKGPPPAVAKKPAHLSSARSTESRTPSQAGESRPTADADKTDKAPLSRQASSNVQELSSRFESSGFRHPTGTWQGRSTPATPQPRGSGAHGDPSLTGPPAPSGGIALPGWGEETRNASLPPKTPPKPVPPRKPVAKEAVDLLGDDGSHSMNGWEALKPSG